MGLIDIAIADAKELPVIDTPEVLLTIVGAEVVPFKNDPTNSDKQLHLTFQGPPECKKVHQYLAVVKSSFDDEQKAAALVRLKQFMEAFQIFPMQIETTGNPEVDDGKGGEDFGPVPSFIGKTGWVTGAPKEDAAYGKRYEISGYKVRR